MSYTGQGDDRTRLSRAALANIWLRTGYPLVFGCRALATTEGAFRFGQQTANAIATATDAEAALVRGPFCITDFAVSNRVAAQTTNVDYSVWVDNVITGFGFTIAAGNLFGSDSGFETFGAGLHLVRLQFNAGVADATLTRPGGTIRLVELPE